AEAIAGGAGSKSTRGCEGVARAGGSSRGSDRFGGTRYGAARRFGEAGEQDQPEPAHRDAASDGGSSEWSLEHTGRVDEGTGGMLHSGMNCARGRDSDGGIRFLAERSYNDATRRGAAGVGSIA